MCKVMPVIPVNRVVDPKRIIRKNGGRGEAQRVADLKKNKFRPKQFHKIDPSTLPIPEDPDDGLSGGAIAGIVIGCLLLALIAVIAGYLLKQKM
jgi:hypothetical protein